MASDIDEDYTGETLTDLADKNVLVHKCKAKGDSYKIVMMMMMMMIIRLEGEDASKCTRLIYPKTVKSLAKIKKQAKYV